MCVQLIQFGLYSHCNNGVVHTRFSVCVDFQVCLGFNLWVMKKCREHHSVNTLHFVCCGVFLCNFIHICSKLVCKCVTFLLVYGPILKENHNILSYILLKQIISSAVVHFLVSLSIFRYQFKFEL